MPSTRMMTLAEGLVTGRVRMQLVHTTGPTNPALILAPGATIKAYRLGATSTDEYELLEGSTTQIDVVSSGQVQVGDLLIVDSQIDVDPSEWLYVSAVAADHSWVEVQYSGARLMILAGTRMTPSGVPPQMYTGGLGGTPVSSVTADARGLCDFYTSAKSFDYTVHHLSSTGWGPQLLTWESALDSTAADGFLNGLDFPSLQTAMNALPLSGGTVFMPAGLWVQSTPILFPTDRPVRLVGAGRTATVLHWPTDPTGSGSTQSDGLIRVRGDNQVIESLTVRGPGSATRVGPGRGVVVGRRAGEMATTHPLRGFQLRDCEVVDAQGWALCVYGTDTATDPYVDSASDMSISIMCSVHQCTFAFNRADGLIRLGSGCVSWDLSQVTMGASTGYQLQATGTSLLRLQNCDFDEPVDDLSGKVLLTSCSSVTFDTCDFENPICTLDTPYFITLAGPNCNNIALTGCSCFRSPAVSVPTGERANVPAHVLQSGTSDSVSGLRIIGLQIYLHLGAGIVSQAADDIVIRNALSDCCLMSSVRGDDAGYSEMRVNSVGRRTVIMGPDRIRLPQLDNSDMAALNDVVPGDMVFNTTLRRPCIYCSVDGSAPPAWHALVLAT